MVMASTDYLNHEHADQVLNRAKT